LSIAPHIFRKYSVRGVVGEDFDVADAQRIGLAAGTYLSRLGCRRVVVGHDGRLSSPGINAALIDGLLTAGMEVLELGLVPTPVLNFSTDYLGADAGIMVTASHNPPDNNGLKFRTDHTLQGDELLDILKILHSGEFTLSPRPEQQAQKVQVIEEYRSRVADLVHLDRPLKVVVDAGNGTNGLVVPSLLEQLGCTVLPLYCEVDGNFPHRPPDPTVPGALADLEARVRQAGADLGVAYDGDGDRLAVVDEHGHTVLADMLLILLARARLAREPNIKVVYELLCSQAVPDAVREAGGVPIPSAVGYAAVHETMRREQAALGGEMAGHIFFDEPDFQFDDAILATARVLEIAASDPRPFSALLADIPRYYTSPEFRPQCPDEHKQEVVSRVREYFEKRPDCSLNTMDGVQVLFGDAWALIRQSQTQPRLSLRFEARNAERLASVGEMVLHVVQQYLTAVGTPIPTETMETYLTQIRAASTNTR